MDEEIKKEDVVVSDVDAFGQLKNEDIPIVKPEKKEDEIPEDHPIITTLKAEIENVKKEYGGNLSGQREVITRLENEIAELKKSDKKEDAGENEDVLYEEIKFSKDLTEEERDEIRMV